jgi:hypothetical protein
VLVPQADKGRRLAFHQIAHKFLHAGALAGVLLFIDRAGLPTQFKAEEAVF